MRSRGGLNIALGTLGVEDFLTPMAICLKCKIRTTEQTTMLYPLRFTPIMREMIWGGGRLVASGKKAPRGVRAESVGESWEISGLEEHESVAANGYLKSNSISELIEVYMGELVGDGVYDKFGLEFPLLLKFIDVRERLSVQVHPDDEFARKEHGARGKTEMWYIVDATPDAAIFLDLKHPLTDEAYDLAVEQGTIEEHLNRIPVKRGDAFLIPAGTIHSIDKGVLLAEIQECSNITYRIHDWNRLDHNGRPRELHYDLAAQVVRLSPQEGLNITKEARKGEAVELVACDQFCVNLIEVAGAIELDYAPLDSFVAYMCVEGEVSVSCCGESEKLGTLQTLLLPAEATDVVLKGSGRVLEVFIK